MAADPSFEQGRAGIPDDETVRQPATRDFHPTAEMPEVDTGTGWSDRDSVAEPVRGVGAVEVRKDSRFEEDDGAVDPPSEQRGSRRRFGCLGWLVGLVVIVVVLAVGAKVTNLWPHLSNPFASKTTDRSQPTLLLRIQDLARFEAATGEFQEIIDSQKDKNYIPDVIFSERTLFVCVGSVDAFVDFGHIANGDITESADHKTATVKLPAPELEKPNIDHDKSEVVWVQQGLWNKFGDFFTGGNANKEAELYQLGEQRIAQAAKDSGLPQRAADNTKAMLTQLLQSLGYTTVNISVANP
jgi:hypothetical protein